jgi:hemolysin III
MWVGSMYPEYTKGEILADACIHVVGIVLGLVGVSVLLTLAVPSLPLWSTTSLAIYGVALIAMLAFSAAYHMIPVPSLKGLLRRFDQAAIFVKIAGTYTPFTLVKMSGAWGWGLFGTVWVVAMAGALTKLFLAPRWNGLATPIYLLLGWAGIFAIGPLFDALPTAALVLLGVGGVLYSIGVIFLVWEKLPYQNAVWHLFVLAGTACHFAAIVDAVLLDAA